ncbi:MAG: 5-aminolevulinate synthase [Candidatus Marinimicrobia bacterium]|nr:5-aminolevulinate synthase [Candidatus Neomarinimicrobiota bacterium]
MNYKKIIKNQLDEFQSNGFGRTFTPIYRRKESFPFTEIDFSGESKFQESFNSNTTIWCSNDYLNMSHHPAVIDRMIEIIKTVGTGSGGTRNISGSTPYHNQLESDLAKFHKRERGLIFTSAYVANQTTLATLCKRLKGIQVFSDELNHASLIEGIKNSKADCSIFRHNDLDHLEELLKSTEKNIPKIIVFESLYSMDGTETNISDYVALAKKYDALTYLDEVHAVGLYGAGGRGVAYKNGVSNDIDIINGTLAKGFGQIGGYIVGDDTMIDFIRSFAPGFIFTTSMMPSIAAASSKSISIVEGLDEKREDIFNKAKYIRNRLTDLKIPFVDSDSHIIPLLAYSTSKAKAYSRKLLDDHNIYIQPIFYPTVPRDSARLRITVTPKHTKDDINHLLNALSMVWNQNNIVMRATKSKPIALQV